MKKLISMTEYVLQKAASGMDSNKLASMVVSYAAFLKQPLQLWMFIPCDEEGNILKIIPFIEHRQGSNFEWLQHEKFREAKDKVIFNGDFKVIDEWRLQFPDGTSFGDVKGLKNYPIEYLVHEGLELTDEIAAQFEL